MDVDILSPYGVGMIPVVLGLVEMLKRYGLPRTWAPLASLFLGMVASFVYIAPDNPKKALLSGLLIGLGAIGLYSTPKHTVEGMRSLRKG